MVNRAQVGEHCGTINLMPRVVAGLFLLVLVAAGVGSNVERGAATPVKFPRFGGHVMGW